jgi:hypothetical protein
MNKSTRRRRAACRGAARTLAVATAMAALVATLSVGQALAGPDERVLERQGRIDREAEAGQAGEQGKAALPPQLSSEDKDAFAQAERERSQQPSATTPRRHFPPEPPVHTGPPLGADEQPAPAPPKAPADSRAGLAVTLAAVALLLAVGAATTWRIHRRPRPEPTT